VLDPSTPGTLITATARLSRQLRREYDAARGREHRLWESPDILPRDAWLERVWREVTFRDPMQAPLLLNSAQADALWEKAIRASEEVAEPARVLLDLPATVSAASRAWDLFHVWEAPFDAADDDAEFSHAADPAAFAGWKRTVEQELARNGWITKSQLPGAIAERVSAGVLPITGPLAYAGFQELTPADRRLFGACSAIEQRAAPLSGPPTRCRVACESAADEFTHAAVWARGKLEANPSARIGILVRGLAEHATTVTRIFDDILHPDVEFAPRQTRNAFQVSMGAALLDTPMVASALLALGLPQRLPLPDAAMLLRSPFLSVTRVAGARMEAFLRQQGVEKVSFQIDAVRRALPGFAQAAADCPARLRPSEWSVAFSRFLSLAGWPGTRPLSPVEYDTLDQWKALLSEFASLDLVLPRIDYARALARLRRMARARRFVDRDEDAPIQVMDIRQSVGTRWDAVWIAGLDASAWPEAPRANPFLPLSLQRALGMPHSSPERELADARRTTEALLSSAPEVVCSYARHAGEETLRVSPLIEDIAQVTLTVTSPATMLRQTFAAGAMMPEMMQDQPPDQAPSLTAGTLQRGGMSVLRDQAACPFRAFAVHRLGARETDAADLGISPAERGSVAHEALDLLWRELKTQTELLALSREQTAALISRNVRAALDGRLSRRHKNRALDRARDLEQSRWERLIADWIEFERRRDGFEVVETEESRDVDVGGLKLRIKADRIDRLDDGSFAILDYKTSDKLSPKGWEGDRPDAPQLPLYYVKSDRDISAVHFAQLVPGDVETPGLGGPELAERKAGWTTVVDSLGGSFLQGDAAVDPKQFPKTCEFCHLEALCRIGELIANPAEEEDADE
jgi:ATP-dependent helicase/nuclease subunit B